MTGLDRRLLDNIDWPLLAVTLSIILAGLPVMYSASLAKEGSGGLFADHLARLGAGLLVMVLAALVDYHFVARQAYALYVLNVVLLAVVTVSGVIGFGARRWLSVGPVAVQPSELFKLTLIILMARYLSRLRHPEGAGWGDLTVTGLLVAPPLLLVLKQPDLGTAGTTVLIYLTMLGVAGLSRRTRNSLVKAGLVLVVVTSLLAYLGVLRTDRFLKPYQVKRIKVLFNPELDPLGASYHINQSKIAIGSGGFLGKGFLNGTQSQLRFLPQQHTDFIFSVLAEEWGFAGVFVVLLLYLFLILRAIQTARDARDGLGGFMAAGVAAMILFHSIINIGMTVGVMPVVGLPLPLMSYGGSSFMVVMVGIGLLLNVRMRRFVI